MSKWTNQHAVSMLVPTCSNICTSCRQHLSLVVDWVSLGLTSRLTQNKSFQIRSFQLISWLILACHLLVCLEHVLIRRPAVLSHHARCWALTKKNVSTARLVIPVSCALLLLLYLNSTPVAQQQVKKRIKDRGFTKSFQKMQLIAVNHDSHFYWVICCI